MATQLQWASSQSYLELEYRRGITGGVNFYPTHLFRTYSRQIDADINPLLCSVL